MTSLRLAISACLLAVAVVLGPLAALPTSAAAPSRGEAVRRCTNSVREAYGLRDFRRSAVLARAARRHARDMARRNYLGHVSPAGADPRDRVRAAGGGYVRVRENVGYGFRTPRRACRGWLRSPGHRKTMLARVRYAGSAYAYRDGRRFYVLVVARRR